MGFCLDHPLTYTTLIAKKAFFIVKTFIIHKFTYFLHLYSEMYFLREQLFWSLWFLISVAAALFSWLLISAVADLLNSLILSRTEPKKIFIKVFTTSKTFAILTCINTNLRCIKDCGLL